MLGGTLPEALVLALRLYQQCGDGLGWLDTPPQTKVTYVTAALVLQETGKQMGDIVPPVTEEQRDRLRPQVDALLAYTAGGRKYLRSVA